MTKKTTVTIYIAGKPVQTTAYHTQTKGLVANRYGNKWVLTHEASGKHLGRNTTFYTLRETLEFARDLDHLVDWTLPERDLLAEESWLPGQIELARQEFDRTQDAKDEQDTRIAAQRGVL